MLNNIAIIPQLRTIGEAIKEIKESDPHSSITKNYIKTLVASGKIPCTYVGKKRLLHFTSLLNYLSCTKDVDNTNTADTMGVIRPIH